jgi:hypothetical protein
MMIDKNLLEIKHRELIESLNIGIDTAESELEKLISYLHQHSDQRRKPSEQHGLDKWAFDTLGLEKPEYTDEERKLLKQFYSQVENDIIKKSKFLLEILFQENRWTYIKGLFRRQLKDELKIHICNLIATESLSGFEESIINLYLKGTKKSSQAAFECMQSLKDIKFYYPLKQLKPSRYELNAENIEGVLREFKKGHLEIEFVEGHFLIEKYQAKISHFDIQKLCDVLIALSYLDQKSIYQQLRSNLQDHFNQIGRQLECNYSDIKQIKSKDYLSNLKKALGDSLMIGGWELKEETEFLLARNLASQKDLGYVEQIINSLDIKYRHQYFKSVLNPPKHIKGEFNKERLFWVYNQILSKFKSDFEKIANFIKWHLGNDDPEIKIETLLLIASIAGEPEKELAKSLTEFSQDDRFQKFHDRINLVLPDDSLMLDRKELSELSDAVLESKLSIILSKQSPSLFNNTIAILCDYLKEIKGDRFEFVFEQTIYLSHNIRIEDNSAENIIFKTLVDILQQDKNIVLSFRKDFLLTNHYFLQLFCDHYPQHIDLIPKDFISNIFGNCFSIQTNTAQSIQLALKLSSKDPQYKNLLWGEWAKKFVLDRNKLIQVIDSLTPDETKDLFDNILVFISYLKKELLLSEDHLYRENERMQKLIASEILPKLERAKRRAGDQPLLTENYDMIIRILSDYTQKGPAKTLDINKTTIQKNEHSKKFADNGKSLVEIIEIASSIPLSERNKIIKDYLEERCRGNELDKLLHEINGIPSNRKEWFLYRLFDYVLDSLVYKDSLFQYFKTEEQDVWGIMNKMLYRLYTEHQEALKQIQLSRDNKLKEIGKAISEFLEKIEINLFGYYELSENLSKLGLKRIFNKPGEIVFLEDVDVKQHKVLPSQKEAKNYQVITLGLKLQTGETVREAFLESKED